MSLDYSFLNEMDESPLFRFLSERGEGRLHQIACMISWSCTPEGKRVTSLGGKNASPYLSEWVKCFAKNFPGDFSRICSLGGKTMQEKLNNDPELKREHYSKVAASIILWNSLLFLGFMMLRPKPNRAFCSRNAVRNNPVVCFCGNLAMR